MMLSQAGVIQTSFGTTTQEGMKPKVTPIRLETQVPRVTNHQVLLKVSPSSKLKNERERGEEVQWTQLSNFCKTHSRFEDLEAQEWREVWGGECSFEICLRLLGGGRSTVKGGVKGYI